MDKNKFSQKDSFSFEDLTELVDFLRSPEGCPWDKVQSHQSIRNHFIEEAYEVCEGIDNGSDALLCEELGDMLFQVLFHISIAKEENRFTLEDVLLGICKKMITRHPFLFQGEELPKDQIQNWEEIKKKEKGEKNLSDSLSRISTSLPALKRAEKFLDKGAVKQDTETENDPLLKEGEKLFDLVKECKEKNIDPEQALNEFLLKILDKMYKL